MNYKELNEGALKGGEGVRVLKIARGTFRWIT